MRTETPSSPQPIDEEATHRLNQCVTITHLPHAVQIRDRTRWKRVVLSRQHCNYAIKIQKDNIACVSVFRLLNRSRYLVAVAPLICWIHQRHHRRQWVLLPPVVWRCSCHGFLRWIKTCDMARTHLTVEKMPSRMECERSCFQTRVSQLMVLQPSLLEARCSKSSALEGPRLRGSPCQ